MRVLDYVQAVQVGVEACVANSEADDGCVQGATGGVGLPGLGGCLSVTS